MQLLFRLLACWCGILIGSRFATAHQPLASMVHTSWTSRNGAPQSIRGMAEGMDGRLWLASQSGLVSFDGVEFEYFRGPKDEVQLPAGGVTAVYAARNGAIWVALAAGGVAEIRNGHVSLFAALSGGPIGKVIGIQEGPGDNIWCATDHALYSFGHDERWRSGEVLEAARIRKFRFSRDGALWLGSNKGLYRRGAGDLRLTKVSGNFGIVLDIAMLPKDKVLVSDFITGPGGGYGRTQVLDSTGISDGELDGHDVLYSLLPADDGTVILGTENQGLRRAHWDKLFAGPEIHAVVDPDEAGKSNGLTSDIVYSLVLDRDGNVWAGTKNGLDRLSPARVLPFTAQQEATDDRWVLCANNDSGLWLASDLGKITNLKPTSIVQYGKLGEDIYSIACGPHTTWFINQQGLWNIEGGQVRSVRSPPGWAAYHFALVSMMKNGSLLLNEAQFGLWLLSGSTWSAIGRNGPISEAPTCEFLDNNETIWTSYSTDRRIGSLKLSQGALALKRNPGIGLIGAFAQAAEGVIAGGTSGVALWNGGDFKKLLFSEPSMVEDVTSMVLSDNGDLWLLTSRGIVHVSKQQLEQFTKQSSTSIQAELIAENNYVGWAYGETHYTCDRGAANWSGKLWFSTLNGVVSIDPSNQPPKPKPPLVSIKSIEVDGQPLRQNGVVPPFPGSLQIRYIGVNLSSPQSVVYRYRLSGLDDSWQNAGSRDEAIYTHLPPGQYRFDVVASNGDEVWTEPVSSQKFTVSPAFYQTRLFGALCILTAGMAIWISIVRHLKGAAATIRGQAEARADERIRIAQDFHDTILQGVQGLLMHVHVVSEAAADDQKSRALLRHALSAAGTLIDEGRDRLSSLRSEEITGRELASALVQLGEQLRASAQIHYSVEVKNVMGISVKELLEQVVSHEVFYVAREAIINAFRHAHATEINVLLHYGWRSFTILCNDNGSGFSPQSPIDKGGDGHWGILGMAERARRIGGRVIIASEPGGGTEIKLIIPARKAYVGWAWLRLATAHLLEKAARGRGISRTAPGRRA